MSMNIKKMFLCLMVGWAGLQTLVAVAATVAAAVATDTDALIDTRMNLAILSADTDALIDTRINFVVRSAAPGTKIDTLTPSGTLIMVH